MGLMRKLQNNLLRPALITIYKAFVKPHVAYGDLIYDEAYSDTFHQKLESIWNYLELLEDLALSGTIRGSSREKLHQELGLESL